MDIIYLEEGELKAVVFDATLKVVPTGSSIPTEHPVEGRSITDHVKNENDRLTAECFVTNKPIYSPNADGMEGSVSALDLRGSERKLTQLAKVSGGQANKAEYSKQDKNATAQVLQFANAVDRMSAIHTTLNRIRELHLECSISTPLGVYDGMYITGVSSPRETQESVTFTIDAVRLTLASTETVEVETLETRAERERRLGATGDEELEGADESLAFQALTAISDFIR